MGRHIDQFVLAGGGIGKRLPRHEKEKIAVRVGEGQEYENKLPVLAFPLGSMVAAGITKGTVIVAFGDGEVQPWLESIKDPKALDKKSKFVQRWLELCRAATVDVVVQPQGDLEPYGTAVALALGAKEGQTVAYSTADEFLLNSRGDDGVMRALVSGWRQSGLPNAMAYRVNAHTTAEDVDKFGFMLGDTKLERFVEKQEAAGLPLSLLNKVNISRGVAGPTVIATAKDLVRAQMEQIEREGVRNKEAYVTTAFETAAPEGVALIPAPGDYYDVGNPTAYAATDQAVGRLIQAY